MKTRLLLSAAAAVLAACGMSDQASQIVAADAIYMNARFYAVDTDSAWASAMAVSGGKIIATGSDAED